MSSETKRDLTINEIKVKQAKLKKDLEELITVFHNETTINLSGKFYKNKHREAVLIIEYENPF